MTLSNENEGVPDGRPVKFFSTQQESFKFLQYMNRALPPKTGDKWITFIGVEKNPDCIIGYFGFGHALHFSFLS